MHLYDSDLSIHVCLSMLATWHSHKHSQGSSDSPGSLCPGLGSWNVWILPVADQSAQLKRGSPTDRPEPYPSRALVRLSSFPL